MDLRAPALIVSALLAGLAPRPAGARERPSTFEEMRTRALVLRAEDERDGRDPLLHAALEHASAAIRARAVRALGRIGDPSSVGSVAARVGDASPAVRLEAVFALGEIESPAALTTLVHATLDRDPEVRSRAAEALSKIAWGEDPGRAVAARAVLTRLLGAHGGRVEADTDALVRVLECAWRFGPKTEGLAGALADMAASSEVRVSEAALLSAARLGDHALGAVLLEARDDATPMARALAARGLGRLARAAKDAGTAPEATHRGALVELARDPNAIVRIESLRALAAFEPPGDDAAVEILSAHLAPTSPMGSVDAGIVRAALELARTWKTPGAAPAVRAALASGALDLVPEAAAALAAIEGPAALPDLLPLAESPDWRLRASVAEALAGAAIGSDERGRRLQDRLLGDADARVVAPALEAAAASGREDAEILALAHLASSDTVLRAVAASLLPGLSADDVSRSENATALREAFRDAAADRDPDARLAALDALAQMKALDAGELALALEHGDPAVRRHAAQHLEKLGSAPAPRAVTGLGRPLTFYLAAAFDEVFASPRVLRFTTDRGVIDVDLLPAEAVLTVRALEDLARAGHFDGLTFHRVVAGFVAQGGCPRGDGSGGPGYALRCEISPRHYQRGAAGMALSGKDTGGSQFFFTLLPQPHLDGGYTIFGQVRPSSLPVMDAIRRFDVIRKAEVRWPDAR